MLEKAGIITRITVRIRALRLKDWLGQAGARFRQITAVISDFTKERIRPVERLNEAPDLAWNAIQGAALEKHANALREYAEEENTRIDIELKLRTLRAKARQEDAIADKLECEARVSQIEELERRLKLADELKRLGALPVWDSKGNMTIHKAPAEFDWDAQQVRLFETNEMPLPKETSEPKGSTRPKPLDQHGTTGK